MLCPAQGTWEFLCDVWPESQGRLKLCTGPEAALWTPGQQVCVQDGAGLAAAALYPLLPLLQGIGAAQHVCVSISELGEEILTFFPAR